MANELNTKALIKAAMELNIKTRAKQFALHDEVATTKQRAENEIVSQRFRCLAGVMSMVRNDAITEKNVKSECAAIAKDYLKKNSTSWTDKTVTDYTGRLVTLANVCLMDGSDHEYILTHGVFYKNEWDAITKKPTYCTYDVGINRVATLITEAVKDKKNGGAQAVTKKYEAALKKRIRDHIKKSKGNEGSKFYPYGANNSLWQKLHEVKGLMTNKNVIAQYNIAIDALEACDEWLPKKGAK